MLLPWGPLMAQPESKWAVGTEQDVLPYLFNGYFGNVWVGKGHWRSRILLARVRKPDFVVKEPFENHVVHAYAITLDYFPSAGWRGWWLSGGLVRWQNSIGVAQSTEKRAFGQWLLNGSVGYNWIFLKRCYAGPWAGLHVSIAGNSSVDVAGYRYTPARLNPEASVKVGCYF